LEADHLYGETNPWDRECIPVYLRVVHLELWVVHLDRRAHHWDDWESLCILGWFTRIVGSSTSIVEPSTGNFCILVYLEIVHLDPQVVHLDRGASHWALRYPLVS
jgi:hypothetical protein